MSRAIEYGKLATIITILALLIIWLGSFGKIFILILLASLYIVLAKWELYKPTVQYFAKDIKKKLPDLEKKNGKTKRN